MKPAANKMPNDPPPMPATFTAPQLAERWGVDPHKVVTFIRNGELRAFNIATVATGRPRFRISREAVLAFEEARAIPTPAPRPPRRRRPPPDVIEFY